MIKMIDDVNLALRMEFIAKRFLAFFALLYFAAFFGIAFSRINHPYLLDGMEGASAENLVRLLKGLPLYTEPGLEFTANIYPPLFYYLAAMVYKVTGGVLLSMRIMALISTLTSFAFITAFVKKETGSNFYAMISGCLFMATYHISADWFDLAKCDSVYLAFFLASMYVARFSTSLVASVFGGFLLALSFLAKQPALMMSLPMFLYLFFVNRAKALSFFLAFAIPLSLAVLYFNHISDGWFSYFIFTVPANHPLVKSMFMTFWITDILAPLALATLVTLYYFARYGRFTDTPNVFYIMLLIGMIGGAFSSRLHSGGHVNVLFPAYAALSISFGLSLHGLEKAASKFSVEAEGFVKSMLLIICFAQFATLAYDPFKIVPARSEKEATDKFIELLKTTPGEVYFHHGYLAALTGKKQYSGGSSLVDVLRMKNQDVYTSALAEELNTSMKKRLFTAIFVESGSKSIFPDLAKYYEKKPVEGLPRIAGEMFVPKPDTPPERGD